MLQHAMWQAWDFAVDISLSQLPNILERSAQYNASSFFEEQLTAFEVWLKYGGEKRPPPEQVHKTIKYFHGCIISLYIKYLNQMIK